MWERKKAIGVAEYRNKLNDTSIVSYNGQDRIKAAVILEKMCRKKRTDRNGAT
jgi:hypothetical protein